MKYINIYVIYVQIFPFAVRNDYPNIIRRYYYYYPPLNINHQKIFRSDKLPCNWRSPSSVVFCARDIIHCVFSFEENRFQLRVVGQSSFL